MIWWYLAACIKTAAPVQAPTSQPVGVAVVLSLVDEAALQEAPEAFSAKVHELLSARNLPPKAIGGFLEPFRQKRATPHRIAYLLERADGLQHVLLLEARVAYYSQMNGRFRWTVDIDLTMAPVDGREPMSDTFSIPVFLDHFHEREEAALQAAAPMLDRKLGALLDRWVGGI